MSLADSARRLLTDRTSARPVAVARIVVGAAALGKAADIAPVLHALVSTDVFRFPYFAWTVGLPPHLSLLPMALWVTAGLAFLLGWRTRPAGVLLVMAMAAVFLFDQQLYGNHFYLLILLCSLLTVADSGAALSLDARRRGVREWVPAWPVTLLKLQLSIVYGFAVLAKLNLYYLSGAVLNIAWVREGWFALPDTLRRVEVMAPLALASLLAELTLALGMWIPRVRHHAFVLGLGLHVAIIPTMGPTWQLTVFASIMFALYLLFLDARPRSRLVIWDEECSFCRAWVRWLQRMDWLRVHRFAGSGSTDVLAKAGVSRDEADAAIQLIGADGDRASGFRAVRSILEMLPLCFLWAPLLRFPPVDRAGRRGYAAVAARRKCRMDYADPELARSGGRQPPADPETSHDHCEAAVDPLTNMVQKSGSEGGSFVP